MGSEHGPQHTVVLVSWLPLLSAAVTFNMLGPYFGARVPQSCSMTLISARIVSWGVNNDAPLVELRQGLGQVCFKIRPMRVMAFVPCLPAKGKSPPYSLTETWHLSCD
eukprot:scaffold14752_cov19-Tisochrysis_lutea.AAC.1